MLGPSHKPLILPEEHLNSGFFDDISPESAEQSSEASL